MLESLYDIRSEERSFWGDKYLDAARSLAHGRWMPIARYPAQHEDGEDAQVFICAMPARFYRVTGKGIDVSTGSGDDARYLVHEIATAIATGMLGACRE